MHGGKQWANCVSLYVKVQLAFWLPRSSQSRTIIATIGQVKIQKAILVIGLYSIVKIYILISKVTEQEVVRGLLNAKDNVEHTLAFIREIRNINVKLFTHSAKFIDINFAARKIDEEAQSMLSLLRDVKVS